MYLLEICYFYISQTKSNLDKIFYNVVYHRIIYMCDFFGEFRRLFYHGLDEFSRKLRFAPDIFPLKKRGAILFKDILIKYVPRRAVLNVVSAPDQIRT